MDIEFLVDFPIHMGGLITLEMPGRLQVSTSLGELPAPFVDVINATAMAFDAYGDDTAELVRSSLHNSLVWRLHVGWRPLEDEGLFASLGYSLVTLGSYVRGDTVVTVLEDTDREAITDAYPAFEEEMRFGRYDVFSSLHMLGAEVGWRWVLDSGWSLRVAVGVAVTLVGQTEVTPVSSVLPDEVEAIVTQGTKSHLDTIYRHHVHTPVVSVGVGHRFF